MLTPSSSQQQQVSASGRRVAPAKAAATEPRVILKRVDLLTLSPASRHVPAATMPRPPPLMRQERVVVLPSVDLTTPSPSRQMSRRVASAVPADATPLDRAPREPRVILERIDLLTPTPASRHVPAATTPRPPPDDGDGGGGAPSEVPQGIEQRREGIITSPPSTSREAAIMGSTPRPKQRKRASATTIFPISPPAAAIPTISRHEIVHIQMQHVGRQFIMTQTQTPDSVQPVSATTPILAILARRSLCSFRTLLDIGKMTRRECADYVEARWRHTGACVEEM
ncbi:PREDICTED: mucin-7-like [Wasmannia auropunctata]|uniref:mucin-7-like n=1 Tax=Wasmannia auropunctata TaxID=64793 RepID=UPI0005EE0C7B|nr:PREDICTED: mucin-7-like [Wasmannia auropunctata]